MLFMAPIDSTCTASRVVMTLIWNVHLPVNKVAFCVNFIHCTVDVLKTTLSLYMEDASLPMPTHEEVLVCSERTTEEEVSLLWKRALGDPNYFRIFCLVHAERLSYQACDKALKSLSELSQGKKG